MYIDNTYKLAYDNFNDNALVLVAFGRAPLRWWLTVDLRIKKRAGRADT